EEVAEPVDEVIVGLRGLAGLRRRGLAPDPVILGPVRAVGRARHEEAAPVRRPFEPVDPAWEVGQPARLAAVERQEVDLLPILAALRLTGVGLLLDEMAPVREERE